MVHQNKTKMEQKSLEFRCRCVMYAIPVACGLFSVGQAGRCFDEKAAVMCEHNILNWETNQDGKSDMIGRKLVVLVLRH